MVLSGTASDNVGVTEVNVSIRNRIDKTWLQSDGVTFAAAYATLPASLESPGGTMTEWSLPLTLPDGSYAVEAKAVDAAGNIDGTPPWVPFGIDTG